MSTQRPRTPSPIRTRRENGFQGDSLRASFKESLAKLVQISTRETAMKDLKLLITQHKTTSNLRVWLSVLAQNRNKHSESEIIVLKYIIEQYGKGLLDPLDKVPSLDKTVFRITEMLARFFKEDLQNVVLACQKAWVTLYLSALIDEQLETKKKLLFTSLEAMIMGGADRISQMTAQFVLDGLLQAILNTEDNEFFKEVAKRTLVLFLKTNVQHWAVFTCLLILLGYFNIMNLLPLTDQIVAKILLYLQSASNNSIGYRIKAEGCKVLALIGEQIDANGQAIYYKIISKIEDLATDKVWAVQVTGRRAVAIWNRKKRSWDQQFQKKKELISQQQEIVQPMQPSNIGNNWMQEQERSKEPQHYRSDNNFYIRPPEQLPQNQTDGWQRQKDSVSRQQKEQKQFYQSGQYLHKNTGIGGGNTVLSLESYNQRQKPQQTYNRKMGEIKKSIYQPKDNFTEYDETIPWEECKDLPVVSKTAGQTALWVQPTTMLLQPPRKLQLPQKPTSDGTLLKQWQHIIELFERNRKEEAVKELCLMDDDIYFLRFHLKYGQGLLKELTRATSTKVLKQMLQIRKTRFMDQTLLKLASESSKGNISKLLCNGLNRQILSELQTSSKREGLEKVSLKVKTLYEQSLT